MISCFPRITASRFLWVFQEDALSLPALPAAATVRAPRRTRRCEYVRELLSNVCLCVYPVYDSYTLTRIYIGDTAVRRCTAYVRWPCRCTKYGIPCLKSYRCAFRNSLVLSTALVARVQTHGRHSDYGYGYILGPRPVPPIYLRG